MNKTADRNDRISEALAYFLRLKEGTPDHHPLGFWTSLWRGTTEPTERLTYADLGVTKGEVEAVVHAYDVRLVRDYYDRLKAREPGCTVGMLERLMERPVTWYSVGFDHSPVSIEDMRVERDEFAAVCRKANLAEAEVLIAELLRGDIDLVCWGRTLGEIAMLLRHLDIAGSDINMTQADLDQLEERYGRCPEFRIDR